MVDVGTITTVVIETNQDNMSTSSDETVLELENSSSTEPGTFDQSTQTDLLMPGMRKLEDMVPKHVLDNIKSAAPWMMDVRYVPNNR